MMKNSDFEQQIWKLINFSFLTYWTNRVYQIDCHYYIQSTKYNSTNLSVQNLLVVFQICFTNEHRRIFQLVLKTARLSSLIYSSCLKQDETLLSLG